MGLDMYIYRKKYLGKGTLEGKITDRKGEVVETKEEGDYFLYLENTNAKYGANIRIIYIRAIDEEKA